MIRAAVIGCGFQGRVHVRSLLALRDVEVVAVCDADGERAQAVADEFGVASCHTDYRQLIDGHDLDLLTICTMPDTHHTIALDALSAGVNVLCEKPFALSADEAREMLAAARRAGRLLAVGFNMRYTDHARSLKEIVDQGELGQPLYARAWARAGEPPWWGPHYVKSISGGGALAATAVHLLDLTLWVAGSRSPVSVLASTATVFPRKRRATAPSDEAAEAYDADDLVAAHVRFADGFFLTLEGSWIWDRSGWDYSFELQGVGGLLEFDPFRVTLERDGGLVDSTPDLGRPVDWEIDFPLSVGREIEDVVRCVREGGTPVADAEQALTVQAITDAVYRSAELGREVAIDPPATAR